MNGKGIALKCLFALSTGVSLLLIPNPPKDGV